MDVPVHMIPLPLPTARLLVREMVPGNWPAVLRYAADPADPDVARFQPCGPGDEANHRAYFAAVLADQTLQPRNNHSLRDPGG